MIARAARKNRAPLALPAAAAAEAAATRPPAPARNLIADALQAAAHWYETVDYGADWQGRYAEKAALYLRLHDIVAAAETDETALVLVRSALASSAALPTGALAGGGAR